MDNRIASDDRRAQGSAYVGTAPAKTRDTPVAPVSVVVPCYRCADTIGPAVASVASQLLRPAEVILVDDCSGDGTLEQLHEVARAYPAGWVKVLAVPRNGGPSGARNLGWAHARQPYVAFLDADDSWHPHKLKIQMDVLESDPGIALLAHRMNVQSRSAPAPALQRRQTVTVVPPNLLMLRSPFPTASIIVRRDLPFRFDEQRRRSEDYLLWAQILLSGYRCARVEQVLASWHKPPFGAGGLSGDLAAMYAAGVDARRALHAQGLLSTPQMCLVHVIGLLRYARRRVITYARRFSSASRSGTS